MIHKSLKCRPIVIRKRGDLNNINGRFKYEIKVPRQHHSCTRFRHSRLQPRIGLLGPIVTYSVPCRIPIDSRLSTDDQFHLRDKTGKTYLNLLIQVVKMDMTASITGSKESRMCRRPFDVVYVIIKLFKRANR